MAFLAVIFAFIAYDFHCLPSNNRGKSKQCDSSVKHLCSDITSFPGPFVAFFLNFCYWLSHLKCRFKSSCPIIIPWRAWNLLCSRMFRISKMTEMKSAIYRKRKNTIQIKDKKTAISPPPKKGFTLF